VFIRVADTTTTYGWDLEDALDTLVQVLSSESPTKDGALLCVEDLYACSADGDLFSERERESFGAMISNVHTELANAHRHWAREIDRWEGIALGSFAWALVHIAVICVLRDWNLGQAITEKMAYNDTRPYRHGGKRA